MKSILIVTGHFTTGGLETHICGEIEHLSESGVKVHLAVGQPFQKELLPAGLPVMMDDLTLDPASSAETLLTAINQLRKIIREYSIEVVHVHPFTSIIPAVAAAELERIPYAITLHGPASMESCGPIYDLLVKDTVLPHAPLIIAVSPEVERLIAIHATDESIVCIPNAVTFKETSGEALNADAVDQRWLVVSRLDQFKIPGIIDFCIKAKACGIPGVVIVGDGPARQQLANMLGEQEVADYVEFMGVSTEVSSLIPRFAGVAGMGRVALEGVAARKPVVLTGYDGVKGILDRQLLARSAEQNFSGRTLPTIDGKELFAQLREKAGQDDIAQVFEFARISFNAKDAWREFLDRISSLPIPAPTAVSGLYHSLSANPVNDPAPYIYSREILDRMATLVYSRDYHYPGLSTAVSLCRQRMEVASLNRRLAYARLSLEQMEKSLSWRLTKPLRWAQQIPGYFARFAAVRRNLGTVGVIRHTIRFIQSGLSSSGQAYFTRLKQKLPLLNRDNNRTGSPQASDHFVSGKKNIIYESTPIYMLLDSFHDGGLERVVIDLCIKLRELGRLCSVLVATDGGRGTREAGLHGIEVVEFHNSQAALRQFISTARQGIVLAHHSYFSLARFHNARMPIVEVLHNAYYWQKGNDEITRAREEFISGFVAVSKFVKSFSVNELDISQHKVTVINNGLSNVDLIRPPLELLRSKRLQTIGEPVLLHVANLHVQKNHRLIVSAFADVRRIYPKARLIMAGSMDGDPKLYQLLLADIRRLGVEDSIELAGAVDRRKLSRLMASAHVGLLPSLHEGFSISTLEYAFFGLPSVLSATGAAEELKNLYGHIEIAEGCALSPGELSFAAIESALKSFPDGAALSLSNAMLKVLANYPVYLEKGIAAGNGFSGYAVEQTAARFMRLLQSLEEEGLF